MLKIVWNTLCVLVVIFTIACGEKEVDDPVSVEPKENGIFLTHEEYYDLVKTTALAEVDTDLHLKAAKLAALELLISEGWRPADCCCSKKEEVTQKQSSPSTNRRGTFELPRLNEIKEPVKMADAQNFGLPSITVSPIISPIFNNNPSGTEANEKDNQVAEKQLEHRDTTINKVLPWEVEFGAGYTKGPIGSLRFGNKNADVGGIFLWNTEKKSANVLVDLVLKNNTNNVGLRYGIYNHTKVAPAKWNIPNEKTNTVSAGGVTTIINSTSSVEVEQWNVTENNVGLVLGAQLANEKFVIHGDIMPGFSVYKKNVDAKPIQINGRLGASFRTGDALLGLSVGLLDKQVYPVLSLRLVPGTK